MAKDAEKKKLGRPPVSLETKLLTAVFNGSNIPVSEFQAVQAWLAEGKRLAANGNTVKDVHFTVTA